MKTRQSIRATEVIEDGSIEDLRRTYGVHFEDPVELQRRADLKERQLTSNKWLGRLLMLTSGRNPAREEQYMRDDIEAARRVTHPQPWAGDQHSDYIGQPQATAEQLQGSTHQQPGHHDAPAVAVNGYVPRHAAEE